MHYDYRIERYVDPPTAQAIERFSSRGWRLVSVTVDVSHSKDQARYVAYLERPAALAAVDRVSIAAGQFGAEAQKSVAGVA